MGIEFLAGHRPQTDRGFRQWMTLKMPQYKSPWKPRKVGLFSPYKYLKNIHFFLSDRWQAGGLKTGNIFAICSRSFLHRFCIYLFIYLFIYWWFAMLFSKARSWFWKLSWRTELLLWDCFLSLVLILSKQDLISLLCSKLPCRPRFGPDPQQSLHGWDCTDFISARVQPDPISPKGPISFLRS